MCEVARRQGWDRPRSTATSRIAGRWLQSSSANMSNVWRSSPRTVPVTLTLSSYCFVASSKPWSTSTLWVSWHGRIPLWTRSSSATGNASAELMKRPLADAKAAGALRRDTSLEDVFLIVAMARGAMARANGATARAAAASRVLTLALEGLVPPARAASNARHLHWTRSSFAWYVIGRVEAGRVD